MTLSQAMKRKRPETGTPHSLFKSPLKILPGARGKNNPMYAYYKVDDKVVDGELVQTALCQVGNCPGKETRVKCRKSTTSSMISHLRSQHKPEFAAYKAEIVRKEALANGSVAKINHLWKVAAGTSESDEDTLGKIHKSNANKIHLSNSNRNILY